MKLKRRRGTTMVETMAAVTILGLISLTVGQLAIMRNTGQVSLDAQYSMLSVDAFFADLYRDYREAVSFDYSESPSGILSLTLIDREGEMHTYGYIPSTQSCTVDGIHQFEASSFEIECSSSSLLITVKLPGEKLMDLCVYK